MTLPYDAPVPYDVALTYDTVSEDAMAVTLGVDTSSHQGTIDWAKVGQTRFQFAIVRMTIGKSTRDSQGRRDLRGALDHLPTAGGYGVVGTAEPVEQGATFLLEEIATITDPTRVLVMLDAENFGDGSHPTIDQVDRYARTLQAGLGRWPIAYIPAWWLRQHGYSAAGRGLANCPWAPSHYFPAPWTEERLQANRPTLELGFKRLAWLQYTSSATCAGVSGTVDANVFYGTLPQFREQLIGGTVSATGPASWDDADWKALDDKRLIRLAQWIAGKTNAVYNTTSVGVQAPSAGDADAIATLVAGKLEIVGITTDPAGVVVVTFGPKT
jgi:GH25 family lysozyme M1 (1,4-beta-N-acetylmuramidase)